jgi:hypothetical protein
MNIQPPKIEFEKAAHSVYGASNSHLWLSCAGATRMNRNKKNETNDAAELGTAGHLLGEWCLRSGLNTFDCIGLTFNKIKVDLKLAEGVQLYVSYVRDICRKHNVNPMLETRVVMTSVSAELFGTSDCVIIIGDLLIVIDYKNGYNVVEVKGNSQAMFYFIAVLDTLSLWSTIKRGLICIVQPNGDHVDGVIRTADVTIEQAIHWQEIFRKGHHAAKQKGALLNAGAHCIYCLSRGSCRPRIMRTLNLIYGEKPINELNEDEIVLIFEEINAIKTNINAVEERTLELARLGKKIEGYKLVNSIQRASCSDEENFVKEAVKLGVKESDLFNRKLISMTDSKKLLKNNSGIVDKFFIKPPASTTLVKMNNSRAAVGTGTAVGIFNPINEKPTAVGIFKEINK